VQAEVHAGDLLQLGDQLGPALDAAAGPSSERSFLRTTRGSGGKDQRPKASRGKVQRWLTACVISPSRNSVSVRACSRVSVARSPGRNVLLAKLPG
jgi:hypothetical protein